MVKTIIQVVCRHAWPFLQRQITVSKLKANKYTSTVREPIKPMLKPNQNTSAMLIQFDNALVWCKYNTLTMPHIR